LDFLARFHRYSLFNVLLIRVQRPGAMAVASRQNWRDYNRTVAPDAVPIVILQPFGPVQFVYDGGDTHGPPLPADANWGPFGATGHIPHDAWDKAISRAAKCGITTELVDNYGSALAGTAAILDRTTGSFVAAAAPDLFDELPSTDGPVRFRIKINRQLDQVGRFATLAHELGHIYCGHLGGDARSRWADRQGMLTRAQRELEAEAVSWLICSRLGLETRSAEYLANYVDEGDHARISTFVITAAARLIEAWR
jgi:hypothetical protein